MNQTSRAPVLGAGEFYGRSDRCWRTGLVTLTLLVHDRPRAVPLHSHAHMYIAVLLEGGYREWIHGEELVYQPLTAVFHPENHEHSDEITRPNSQFFAIEIDPAVLGPREQRHRALRSVHDLSGGPAVWSMLRLLEALRGPHRDAIEVEEPVTEILDQLLAAEPPAGPPPRWLARIETALVERSAEPLSLGELAQLARVHPVHVTRVFRRHRGTTIRAFVQQQRVLAAARSIAAGTPLAEAAVDAGFCDQAHLGHVFKHVTGMTPAQYRALRRSR